MANDITATLRQALGRLSAQRERLDRQIAAIEGALGALGRGTQGSRARRSVRRGGRRMSAAARRAVGRRMKAYWAKRRADAAKSKAKPAK
jgi:hypothetical protein